MEEGHIFQASQQIWIQPQAKKIQSHGHREKVIIERTNKTRNGYKMCVGIERRSWFSFVLEGLQDIDGISGIFVFQTH
jgi:hypothetical protein